MNIELWLLPRPEIPILGSAGATRDEDMTGIWGFECELNGFYILRANSQACQATMAPIAAVHEASQLGSYLPHQAERLGKRCSGQHDPPPEPISFSAIERR